MRLEWGWGHSRSKTFRFSNPGGCIHVCITFCLTPSVSISKSRKRGSRTHWCCSNGRVSGLLMNQSICSPTRHGRDCHLTKALMYSPLHQKSQIRIWWPHSVTRGLATNVPLVLSGLQAPNIPNIDDYSLVLPPLKQRMTADREAKKQSHGLFEKNLFLHLSVWGEEAEGSH